MEPPNLPQRVINTIKKSVQKYIQTKHPLIKVSNIFALPSTNVQNHSILFLSGGVSFVYMGMAWREMHLWWKEERKK